MTTLKFERRGRFRLPVEQLWSFVADTDKLNHLVGLPRMHYEAQALPTGGSKIMAEYRLGPVAFARWHEKPMEWKAPTFYAVERLYEWLPLRRFWGGVELTEVEEHGQAATDLRIFAEIIPWTILGDLIVRLAVGPTGVNRAMRQCRLFEREMLARDKPRAQVRGSADTRVARLCIALATKGVSSAISDRLQHHLALAPESELVKMRPFELADKWGENRRAVLAAFLHSTNAGLVTMSWDVLCPNCRIPKASSRSLRELKSEVHCDVCNVQFEPRFDRLIEVRFTVAPGIRRVTDNLYCVGGPMNTPHVRTQGNVDAGARISLEMPAEARQYRLRPGNGGSASTVDVDATEQIQNEVVVDTAGITPALSVVRSSGQLYVSNNTESAIKVVLEESIWPDTIATAAYVSTMSEFLDLFTSDALAPGLSLGVESLTFLFTDLTASTSLYYQIGQGRAFRLVQDHFEILDNAIRAHDGALVKTIGDSVMAVFYTPSSALEAAFSMQESMQELDTTGARDPRKLLKIGIHTGPALAVTLNNRLDYFGSTVNIAARVEHEAAGGEIILNGVVADDPEVQAIIKATNARSETFMASPRGTSQAMRMVRLTPSP